MKMEHQAILDSARRHGCLPSELAHQLLVHDLVEAALFELRNVRAPYSKLNEKDQQEVIERVTLKAIEAADTAVQVISARDAVAIPVKVIDSKFKEKSIAIAATADPQDPNRHGLIDLSGKLCLLVISPNDYQEGLDFIKPDRDQHEMPLHSSDLAAGMGLDSDEDTSAWGADDPLYTEAVGFVTETRRASISAVQRKLKIGYNRAARLIEAMESKGVVSAMNSNGSRDVIAASPEPANDAGQSSMLDDLSNDPTLEDVTRLVREAGGSINATYLHQHLAVDSDKATALLFQLVDAGVIAVENSDAENSADFTYIVSPFTAA